MVASVAMIILSLVLIFYRIGGWSKVIEQVSPSLSLFLFFGCESLYPFFLFKVSSPHPILGIICSALGLGQVNFRPSILYRFKETFVVCPHFHLCIVLDLTVMSTDQKSRSD